WAWDYPVEEGYVIGTGIGIMLIPLIMAPVMEDDSLLNWCYWVGGGISLFGIVWMIVDIASGSDSSYAQAVEENLILKHVSFGTTGEKTYVGVHWRF
ncbi:MAG: hypothetical protein LBG05_08220, partial [Treponema sp.]|nr:hypothetical protein [Treponema sp.]